MKYEKKIERRKRRQRRISGCDKTKSFRSYFSRLARFAQQKALRCKQTIFPFSQLKYLFILLSSSRCVSSPPLSSRPIIRAARCKPNSYRQLQQKFAYEFLRCVMMCFAVSFSLCDSVCSSLSCSCQNF